MTTTKPDVDLAGIRAREQAATNGPWVRSGVRAKFGQHQFTAVCGGHEAWAYVPYSDRTDALHRASLNDAEFIAHAREDIPALLDLVDAQRAEIARLTASASSGRNAGEVENWLEREFGGHGVAIRKQSDPEIPGEPFMSMEVAKDITRRAITATLETRDLAHAGREEQMRRALSDVRELFLPAKHTNDLSSSGKRMMEIVEAALADQPASPTGETT